MTYRPFSTTNCKRQFTLIPSTTSELTSILSLGNISLNGTTNH